MTVITISRQFGTGGETVAQIMARETGFLLVNREVIAEGLAGLGLPSQLIGLSESGGSTVDQEKKRRYYITALHDYIMNVAEKQSIILLGRGGQFLFRTHADAFHIIILAPFEQRVQWVENNYRLEKNAATRLVREHDRLKKRYLRQVFHSTWLDINLYDLVINTSKITPQGAAKTALLAFAQFIEARQDNTEPEWATAEGRQNKGNNEKPAKFMHPSEEELAHVLDFYGIAWQYEPHTFPLQWDREGRVTKAFSPDFFLPQQNLYVELTTQRQKLVWKKNKKLRRLKELYPDINVKIIYNKDYRSLLKKFGMDEE